METREEFKVRIDKMYADRKKEVKARFNALPADERKEIRRQANITVECGQDFWFVEYGCDTRDRGQWWEILDYTMNHEEEVKAFRAKFQ